MRLGINNAVCILLAAAAAAADANVPRPPRTLQFIGEPGTGGGGTGETGGGIGGVPSGAVPSPPPTKAPVVMPTISPQPTTAAPSDSPLNSAEFSNIRLDFVSVTEPIMNKGEVESFEKISKVWYEGFFRTNADLAGARNMSTTIFVTRQEMNDAILSVFYNQSLLYIGLDATVQAQDLIARPFVDVQAKQSYGQALAEQIPLFESVSAIAQPVLVMVDEDASTPAETTMDENASSANDSEIDDGSSTGIIVGVGVGIGVLVVVVAAVFGMSRQKRDQDKAIQSQSNNGRSLLSSEANDPSNDGTLEAVAGGASPLPQPQDEGSTLEVVAIPIDIDDEQQRNCLPSFKDQVQTVMLTGEDVPMAAAVIDRPATT